MSCRWLARFCSPVSTVAIVSAVAVAFAMGSASHRADLALPKSVTAAVAMSISDKLGGVPDPHALLVAITGVLADHVTPLMNAIGCATIVARFCGRVGRARQSAPQRARRRPLAGTLCRHRHGPKPSFRRLLARLFAGLLLPGEGAEAQAYASRSPPAAPCASGL